MKDLLQETSALERLKNYLNYLKTRNSYSDKDREKLDRYFEEE